jgi:hypothetical protein
MRKHQWTSFAIFVAVLLIFLSPAIVWAHGSPTPVNETTNVKTESTAGAVAAASNGPVSSSSTATGVGGSTGPVSSSSSSTATGVGGFSAATGGSTGPIQVSGDTNSSTSRALGLAFPAINFGSATAGDCLAAGPDGTSVGWGFATKTTPTIIEAKVCNLRALSREAASQCQWRTAAHYRAEAAKALGVEPPPLSDSLVDVDPMQCISRPVPVSATTSAPVPVPVPVPDHTTVVVRVEQPHPPAAPAQPPARKAKPPCPKGEKLQPAMCVPEGAR